MKRIIAFLVSVTILAVVYVNIDFDSLLVALSDTRPTILGFSLVLLVVLVLCSAGRLVLLAKTADFDLDAPMAVKATFAANALNLFLPGKLGDLAKASLMRDKSTGSLMPGLRLCIYEKLSDVLAIFVCGGIALGVYQGVSTVTFGLTLLVSVGLLICMTQPWVPRIILKVVASILPFVEKFVRPVIESWLELLITVRRRPSRLLATLLLTLLIWMGHFVQIAIMAWSLGVQGPWAELFSRFPIMILAGLLPVTIAGVGPRDAAIVVLLGPLIGYPVAAALGILFWLRYLVPGLLGLVFVPDFMKSLASSKNA